MEAKHYGNSILDRPQRSEGRRDYEWSDPGPVSGAIHLPEYPVEAFPPIAEDAIAEHWAYSKQPLALLGSSCLGVLSLATQGLADVARDELLVSPCSLYTLVFNDSGERKSVADKAFGKPLREWEREEGKAREKEIRGNRGRLAAWRAKVEGVKGKIKTAAGKDTDEDRRELRRLEDELEQLEQEEPQAIPKPKLFFEEITQQGLTWDLATGYQTASISSEEGGIVLGSAAMRDESATGFQGVLNRLWDGSTYRETRKSADAAEIIGRRLTVSILLQPPLLQQLIDKGARGLGFFARCLIAVPTSTMGKRPYTPPEGMPNMARFHNRLKDLINTPLPLNGEGQLEPPIITLSPKSKEIWIEYHDQVEKELSLFGEYATVKDFGSKSAENAARIACNFHVLEYGPAGVISEDTMSRGVVLARWYLDSARALFFEVSKDQELQDAELLSRWLATTAPTLTDRDGSPLMRNRTLSVRTILTRGPNQLRDKARRDAALIVLADPDVAHIRERREGRQHLIDVNPLLDAFYRRPA